MTEKKLEFILFYHVNYVSFDIVMNKIPENGKYFNVHYYYRAMGILIQIMSKLCIIILSWVVIV